MDLEALSQKAQELHKAATDPSLSDILYPDTIRAEWLTAENYFWCVAIRGIKENKQTPSRSRKFTLKFRGGDPTDLTTVKRRVAQKMLGMEKIEKRCE